MWKEPNEKALDAPLDMKKLIRKSVYWNSEGKLYHSSITVIIQSVVVFLIFASILSLLGTVFLTNVIPNSTVSNFFSALFTLGIFFIAFWYLYISGWKTYREAWYHFDDKDEIFSVIRNSNSGWEMIEIPYEEIHEIEYVEGTQGKAIIKSGPFEFETNRDLEKRATSVIEIWPDMARIGTVMKNWPIELECQKCHRIFGHHIGTAVCPFCDIALIDTKAKGRFDPITQHDDDLDRI